MSGNTVIAEESCSIQKMLKLLKIYYYSQSIFEYFFIFLDHEILIDEIFEVDHQNVDQPGDKQYFLQKFSEYSGGSS